MFLCEHKEIEMQQSSECDSSGRLCKDLDENLQRRIVKTVCLGVPSWFPREASLLLDITKRSAVLGTLLHPPRSAVPGSSSSPPPRRKKMKKINP